MIANFDVLNISAVAAVALILGYTAFWAVRVRGALAVPAYRKQAMGIVLIVSVLDMTLIGVTVSAYVVYGNAQGAIGNGAFGLFFVLLLTIFYWVDSSVTAARRSDPLSRDILRWSRLRILLWIAIIPASAIVIPVNILTAGVASTGSPPSWTAPFLILGIFGPPISGAVMLPLAARRAGDPAFRLHLRWFGLFALAFLVGDLLTNLQPDPVVALFSSYVASLVEAYCLYRSVLSLTPLKSPRVAGAS
jgi:hypothetical protein